jgi:hypothetical protein
MKRITGVAAVVATVGIALIAIEPVHSKLSQKGLIHPVNHFPTWFSDTNGTTLQLCLDGDGANGVCLYDEAVPGNAFSQATGFGPEAFWWSADAVIDLPNNRGAVLVLALEAAYANEDPVDGEQFAFSRVRIRIDTPIAGQYKVWHPFIKESGGCQPEVFTAPAGLRAINVTRDVGGNAPFETMMDGEVGPFLVWDPAVMPRAPAGYVGDPQVEHPVIGSPCGFNVFRIEGPVGTNLDGRGNNVVETRLFSVQGKLYQESNTPPSVKNVRGTYFRSTNSTSGATTARVNLWVEAPPGSTVSVSGLPQANQNGAFTHNGSGGFFRRSTLNATYGTQVPDSVTVTATNSAGTSTSRTLPIHDTVTVQSATWSASARTLNVTALTSDRIRSSAGDIPTLSLRAGGTSQEMVATTTPGRYTASLSGISTPPAHVSVTSSRGGSATAPVAD